MKEEEEISEKNRKGEILDAYYRVLRELETKEQKKPEQMQKEREEKRVVHSASQFSIEGIVKNLADTKLDIGKNLDELEGKLLEEYRKFCDLQKAVEVGERQLEEIHSITVNANTLIALIESQKEVREIFAKEKAEEEIHFTREMDEKRAEWEREQGAVAAEEKEYLVTRRKERQREEDEYQYNTQQQRKKEEDEYEQKKNQLEKELEEKRSTVERSLAVREEAVSARENDLEDLTKQVEAFPQQLQAAVDKAREQAETETRKQLQFEMDLSAKEIEGERRLFAQKIASLENKIHEQEKLIEQLSSKAQEAGQQVQNIAIKAIDGASRTHTQGGFAEVGSILPAPVKTA